VPAIEKNFTYLNDHSVESISDGMKSSRKSEGVVSLIRGNEKHESLFILNAAMVVDIESIPALVITG
jgi:uncharacterized protein YlzI (FlbEa/FlbD family)